MITINKKIIELAKEQSKLHDYISVVVDYKKEEEYTTLSEKLFNEVQSLSSDLTSNDIKGIIQVANETESSELYLYDSDEIIEILFPATIKKNSIIQSAYNWIESKNRIEWLVMNVFEVQSSKVWYNVIDNINDNYIISTKKLSSLK